MATSSLVTGASRETPKVKVLDRVSCICYSVQFRKDKGKDVLALLNSKSEVNMMTLTYVVHLSLKVKIIIIDMQKIDRSSLATYGMVIAAFQFVNKLGHS